MMRKRRGSGGECENDSYNFCKSIIEKTLALLFGCVLIRGKEKRKSYDGKISNITRIMMLSSGAFVLFYFPLFSFKST